MILSKAYKILENNKVVILISNYICGLEKKVRIYN